jgi:acyl-CoA synthetase (AMP-forming)/AMP-acid ligase II
MAENALAVSSTKAGPVQCLRVAVVGETGLRLAAADDPESVEVVSVGQAHVGTTITIRDDDGNRVPEFSIGEICVEGPCVTPGYYNDPIKTVQHLVGRRLRTRDLGFQLGDEFFFVARKDDVLIVGGRNIVPDDVEDCVEAVDHPSGGAAVLIEVPVPSTGKSDLVLLVEIAGRLSEQEARDRRATLQNHVFSQRGVLINRVAFVRKNALERTSSGKKRRQVIRERFVRQQLELS